MTTEAEDEIRLRLAELLEQIDELEIIDPVDVAVGEVVGTVVPLRTHLAKGGLLVCLYDAAEMHLRDVDDRDLLRNFTDYAALTLDRGQAMTEPRGARRRVRPRAHRPRSPRPGHPAALRHRDAAAGGRHARGRRRRPERVEGSVADLDATIRDVRATIFELQTPSAESVRSEVRALVREYGQVLGFAPELRISGPIETAVTEAMREPLLKVLREALSNVARHAHATRVDIVARVEHGRFTLTVDDDGVGVPPGVRAERARERARPRCRPGR